jgi:nucleotide-binding universal stress UspA family protein
MYQHILVPVDGSTTSDRALQESLKLARQQSAQLELVHVVEDIHLLASDSYINYAELQKTIRSNGNKMLAHAQMLVQLAGMAADTKLLEANGERTANVIIAEAERWPADLIVIGTHGRSGVSRLIFGSVAEGVVRIAQTPVLLIRSV